MNVIYHKVPTSQKVLFKKFLIIYIPIVCAVLLFSWGVYYFQHIKSQEDVLRAQEVAIVSVQKELVQVTLRSIISDVKIIAYDQDVRDLMREKLEENVSRLPGEFISFSKYKGIYDQVRVLNKTGMETLRVDFKEDQPFVVPEDKLQFKGNRYYFKDTYKLNKGEIYMSPLDLNIERGEIEIPIKPMVRFGTPLFNEDREKIGVLIVNYLGGKLIEDLDKLSLNTPGHIMLINADGYFLKSIQSEDEWGFMFDERKNLTLQNRYPDLWQKIIKENSGQTKNKNGIFTFNKIYPLKEGIKSSSGSSRPFELSTRDLAPDEYYWILLSHVLPHQLHKAGDRFTYILGLIDFLLLIMFGWVFWKLTVANAYRREAERELKHKNIELEEKVKLRTEELQKRTHDLGERLKELNCLYRISNLIGKAEVSLEKIFQEIVSFIPLSWQYPEISCARIIFADQEFRTNNFKKTVWQQTSDLTVHGEMVGAVEVGYLEEMPEENEGPFLKEERDLIVAIAARLEETIEHRQIEKEKEILESHIQQTQKMEAIGTLAGGIAHDFNNILSAILGYSLLVKKDLPAGSETEKDIDQIITAGKRAANLVKQILSFSRKTEQNLHPLVPYPVVKEALDMMRASLPATITIQKDIDPECGTVLADSTGLHQIVVNLCSNALHAMEDQKGILSVSLKRQEIEENQIIGGVEILAGSFIVLAISDTGCGMEQPTIERIFEPYFTTKELGKGTGMGLAATHGIVLDFKGVINVESTPGQGSTFSIYLPALHDKVPVLENPLVEKTDVRPLTGNEWILVVDDELILVKAHEKHLVRHGYRVTGTTNSQDALEKINSHPEQFDLLITDQTMPGLSGVELAKAVHKIKPSLPIILCTGHSDVVTKEDALSMGIKRYVSKPIYADELFQAIREVLDEK